DGGFIGGANVALGGLLGLGILIRLRRTRDGGSAQDTSKRQQNKPNCFCFSHKLTFYRRAKAIRTQTVPRPRHMAYPIAIAIRQPMITPIPSRFTSNTSVLKTAFNAFQSALAPANQPPTLFIAVRNISMC